MTGLLSPEKWNSKSEVLQAFETSDDEFGVVLAMAKVGWAFCQIHVFESTVSALILSANRVQVGKPSKYKALEAGAALLLKHEKLSRSMLGHMVNHLRSAGFSRSHCLYMETLTEIRNDFIHRFSHQVPLPGDWQYHSISAKEFAEYPQSVGFRFQKASATFPKMMVRAGLLKAEVFSEGMLLFNPDTWT